jgi:hypothetical protein
MNSDFMQNITIEYSTKESQNTVAMLGSYFHTKDDHSRSPSYPLSHSLHQQLITTDSTPEVLVYTCTDE